jgi:cytochrome c556
MKKLFVALAAFTLAGVSAAPSIAADADGRQFVEMSAAARAELRAEMLDFQTALHSIITALGERKFSEAASLAETQIGISAMGRHRNSPADARPGMFMPKDMHAIARGMHGTASDFAKVAKATKDGKGDPTKALVALQAVTGACVACHRSYRTQ